MSHSIPLQLPPDDKLDLVRYLDEFHYWHSLDDERICKRCGRLITGHQIMVVELEGTRGKMRLQCPTVACVSTPSEWIYADPILAAKLRRDFRPITATPNAATMLSERNQAGRTRSRVTNAVPAGKNSARTPEPTASPRRNHGSVRALIARMPLLRTIATALHVIHPVA